MNITSYCFGSVDIGGRTATSDVILTPERVVNGQNACAGCCCRAGLSDGLNADKEHTR